MIIKEMVSTLKELVDLKELQAIQDSFAKTVGTSSVIFSPEGELLTKFSNPTSFCSLIQSSDEGKRRCFQSFMEMSRKALELKEPQILFCFAHVGHFVAPIIINGEHKGTMFGGQFISQRFSSEHLKELEEIAPELNLEPKQLTEEAKKMRVVEDEVVINYSSLLFQIVKVIARQGAQTTELNRAKDKLQKAHDELDLKVEERTKDLREARERLAITLRSIGDGVIATDTEGRVTLMNDVAQELTGWKRGEAMGKPFHEIFRIINDETRNPVEDPVANVLHSGNVVGLGNHSALIAKDGTERAIADSGAPIKVSDGTIIGVVLVFRDVTEKRKAEEEREVLIKDLEENNMRLEEQTKELEEARMATLNIAYDLDAARRVAEKAKEELEGGTRKLERSNKELQDFVYIASHDLREPMRKISAFGELLKESITDRLTEDEEENLGFMIDGAIRMQQMIDALLTYSRVTTKAKPFELVNLNKTIEDLIHVELANQLEETGGVVEVPEPLPGVYADPSQMHQLLQNLIGNGLKYHREDVPPVIMVRGRVESGNKVRIEVQDNGIGIGEENYEKVFGMFKRLHSHEEYEGSGIGLAVCKKIMERHGGEIGVLSVPGEGSTFWYTLPNASAG